MGGKQQAPGMSESRGIPGITENARRVPAPAGAASDMATCAQRDSNSGPAARTIQHIVGGRTCSPEALPRHRDPQKNAQKKSSEKP